MTNGHSSRAAAADQSHFRAKKIEKNNSSLGDFDCFGRKMLEISPDKTRYSLRTAQRFCLAFSLFLFLSKERKAVTHHIPSYITFWKAGELIDTQHASGS